MSLSNKKLLDSTMTGKAIYMFHEKDVREAVKELIQEVEIDEIIDERTNAYLIYVINKIFGEELTNSEGEK